MKKSINSKNNKGFTIIEVVLVLAIAGLIFLMVFLALPALQRSQRDQARKNNVSIVADAIKRWQANNRGRSIASMGTSELGGDSEDKIEGTSGLKKVSALPNGPLDDYLSIKDQVNDISKSSLGSETEKVEIYSSRSKAIKGDAIYLNYDPTKPEAQSLIIRALVGYSCPSDTTILNTTTGKSAVKIPKSVENNVAITTFLESGGFYCQDL